MMAYLGVIYGNIHRVFFSGISINWISSRPMKKFIVQKNAQQLQVNQRNFKINGKLRQNFDFFKRDLNERKLWQDRGYQYYRTKIHGKIEIKFRFFWTRFNIEKIATRLRIIAEMLMILVILLPKNRKNTAT